MEQALIGLAALIVGVAGGFAVRARVGAARIGSAEREAARILAEAEGRAEAQLKEARVTAREELLQQRAEQERELGDRRAELAKGEERVIAREESVAARLEEVARRDQSIADRETHARQMQEELKAAKDQQVAELERVSSMTAAQARDTLLAQVEERSRHEMAKIVRQVDEETKLEADRRARTILSVAIQRIASGHTAETTVSVVQLPSDDLKGRIIGREGRNIRALENLTGVDVIIDDTPQAVVLSAFDGVRRATARLTLDKLIADGRIHPSRIEEMYYQSKAEIEQQILEAGEQACFEANVHGLHPELVKVLGRLHYRTSYGQNVLKHSIECAHLAAIMAAELGASQKTARRAALLHDLGKAVTHEVEGSHAVISAETGAQVPRVAQRRPRHRGAPLRRRAADRGGGAGDRRRLRLGLPAGRPRREPRALHQAAGGAGGDRQLQEGRRTLLRDAGGPRGAGDGQAGGGRRRHRRPAQPRDRPRDRGPARVPGPDQGHGDPRVAGSVDVAH